MASLIYKPDLNEAKRRWDAFWAGELVDRPCVRAIAARAGVEQTPHPRGVHLDTSDFDELILQFDRWAAGKYFAGEAIPAFFPNFGPDQFAAFFGADLKFSWDSPETTWVEPFVEDWSRVGNLEHPVGDVWDRLLQLISRAAELGEGKFICALPDLHTNLDGLSAIRGPQNLCMDLIDQPEQIDAALECVFQGFIATYEAMRQAGRMQETGMTSWLPFYSEGRYAPLQCDFACMVGPRDFRRFILPWLEKEAEFVDHSAYHYDGPDALVHLDDILSIDRIHVIQWQPGAGNPLLIEWIDLLQRIQSAGKALDIWGTPDEIKYFHRHLKPNLVMYDTWCADEKEADELIKWFVENS